MKKLRRLKWFQKTVLSVLLPCFALTTSPVSANPTGGVVTHGSATINNLTSSHLQVLQSTQRAVIDWQSFSIGTGELTEFIQPNGSSSVLNRVVGGNPTAIHGQLQGNGNVYVINPNGILIGASGVIDIGGMAVLSTLDIDNSDFMAGGVDRFYGNTTAGVSNFGTISSSQGDVILLGGFVDNQGQIGALNGTVALGAGGDILLHETGGAKITVQGGSSYTGTGVNNSGVIEGGAAELKAHGNVYALAINNGGTVRANGSSRANGRVRLTSSGLSSNIVNTGDISAVTQAGEGGDIAISSDGGTVSLNAGSIEAVGSQEGGNVSITGDVVEMQAGASINVGSVSQGGNVFIDGVSEVTLDGDIAGDSTHGVGGNVVITSDQITLDANATVNVDGFTQGGNIRIGGEFQGIDVGLREATNTTVEAGATISADSGHGDAGSIVVWANNDTIFRGDVSASSTGILGGNGGLVEVSGLNGLLFDGLAAATSLNGTAGTVLFDPGNIQVGHFATPGVNQLNIMDINNMLQAGTSVILMTQSGNITFLDVGLGGFQINDGNSNGAFNSDRHSAIQWTNSQASFGAFASGSIIVNNHIRTSGAGSVNLMAGWLGQESDLGSFFLGSYSSGAPGGGNGAFPSVITPAAINVETIWDHYLNTEQFGSNGAVIVGSGTMDRHVEVGSRFGNTNIAGGAVIVSGADTNHINRYAQIGFHDQGNVFAPRRTNSGAAGSFRLDMIDGGGNWILSDGLNSAGQAANGIGDPVVGIVGRNEVDVNGDGIMDGVRGVDSSGVRNDTFIAYSNHYNSSAGNGNWWWQQIEDAGNTGPKDPLGLGGLRPENGAGQSATQRADINIISTGIVTVEGGEGRDGNYAMIGHGGFNHSWGGGSRSTRETGDNNPDNANFGLAGVEGGQMERRWSINGSTNDRTATSIARLRPVFGNINVLAGVDTSQDVFIDHNAGTVTAVVNNGAAGITVRGNQNWETGNHSSMSFAQIGHGGAGQFGQFHGDIHAEAGGRVSLEAGTATRSHATIGHTFNGYAYYNVTDNEDQQIRFFATSMDMRNPNLRRGELFSATAAANGTTGFDPGSDPAARAVNVTDGIVQNPRAGTTGAVMIGDPDPGNLIDLGYIDDRGSIDLAPAGPVTVEALDGSVANGLHGDVTVVSRTSDIVIEAGETPADSTVAQTRDRRFAGIGHGGSSFAQWVDGAGYNASSTGGSGGENREVVAFHAGNTPALNGSRSVTGQSGPSPSGRGLTFMTISGDVDVLAAGDVSLKAGNDIFDYARVGHGGNELADHETSSFILGDIRINAGGNISMLSGGSTAHESNRNNYDMSAQAQIGHGGFRAGFFYMGGDIDIDLGGDFTSTAGNHRFNYSQVGHGGFNNFSQNGGDFSRDDTFIHDGILTEIDIDFDATGGTVNYNIVHQNNGTLNGASGAAQAHAGVGMPASVTATAGDLVGGRNTANISINAGGNVTMNHLGEGVPINANQAAAGRTQGSRTDDAWNLIGHGGQGEDALNENNPQTDFGDKIGNVEVISGGDVNMENGNGTGRWTRIGHGVDVSEGNDRNLVSAVEMIGDITVQAAGNVNVNARAASANGNPANAGISGFDDASQDNPVVIGHGGAYLNSDIVVLDDGSVVAGIAASSDINVVAGGNMQVLGGNGRRASYAQVGHGSSGDGTDRFIRAGLPVGFNGDISVHVNGNLLVEGSPHAASPTPGTPFQLVQGAYAAIGNGGYGIDAPANGDIQVFVGNNLDITAQQRTQGPAHDGSAFLPTSGNFAKVGHVGFEHTGLGSAVTNADMSGDINVVVGNDMTMRGGTSADMTDARVLGAFAQVGHGGPGISGDLEGDISVLVGNDLTTVDGSALNPTDGSNNYVMIGNGDWLRNGANFSNIADGDRSGDITVAVGESANLDHTLIGHADPSVGATTPASGNTQVAVSRNNPFFGGTGTLTARNGTVFTSGGFGTGSQMEFFMPARSNNLMDGTTRINEAGAGYAGTPGDFVGLNPAAGALAGRADEVYLTPDLWWDNAGVAGANGIPGGGVFPGNANGAQGGSIAGVNAPGGITNISGLSAGNLGSSAGIYRGGNGVSGAGLYTLYYDAIQPVPTSFPVPPPPPPPPPVPPPPLPVFDYSPFIFQDKWDSYEGLFRLATDDGDLYGSLGYFEGEEFAQESERWWVERMLDNNLGDRKSAALEGEQDEEERRRREREERHTGPVGLTFYVFDPGTNRYSSLRVFGMPNGF